MWTLNFSGNLNNSIQIGDLVYSSGNINSVTGESFNTTDSVNSTDNTYQSDLMYLGTVENIGQSSGGYSIVIDPDANAIPPQSNIYIFFAKDNRANTSSVKGYYNKVKFNNNSKYKAELFATTCTVGLSSK